MACPHCGSWSVKADRSLAGRMVCGRCGRPLGGGGHETRARRGLPRTPRLGTLVLLLVVVSALLAWVAESPRRMPDSAPAGGSPWRPL